MVRLMRSVFWLPAFDSARNTCNVLFVMEEIVNLFEMHFGERLSTTSTFVPSTLLASRLAQPIHNVKVSHRHWHVAGGAHCRLPEIRLMVTFLGAQAFRCTGLTIDVALVW